jgi:hypothetical protein
MKSKSQLIIIKFSDGIIYQSSNIQISNLQLPQFIPIMENIINHLSTYFKQNNYLENMENLKNITDSIKLLVNIFQIHFEKQNTLTIENIIKLSEISIGNSLFIISYTRFSSNTK